MRRERYKRLIMFLASVLVIGLQTAFFAWVWFNEYNRRDIIRIHYWRRGHWALIAMYALTVIVMSKLFGALKVGYMRVVDVIIAQICSVICTNVVEYFQLALIGRWKFLTHAGPLLRLTLVDLVLVIAWVIFMRWIYMVIYPPREVILIYDRHNPEKLLKNIASRSDKYLIAEAVLIDRGLAYAQERISHYQTAILGDMPAHERNVLVKYCFEHNIRCYCSPKISDIMLMSAEKMNMFDTPLLLMRNRGLTAEQQFFKRAADIVLSLAGLIILSPAFALIALLIHLYDGGPVFYRQERLTQGGRTFMILKFRSMKVASEGETARLAAKDDDRVTPVGRVLRKIHFDELPQLINILIGDMSVVGPRPERPAIAAQYEKEIPEFSYRLKVKAGLTGYAQVYGKYNTKPYDKLKLDLTYIENYSIFLDLQLIATTVRILFQKENTEGVNADQVTALTGEELAESGRALESDVQKTVDEIRWQQTQEQVRRAGGTGEEESPEKAAGLPEGVSVEEAARKIAGEDLVSVVIPVHNGAATLPEAIDSALGQDAGLPVEVIVVDDASTDDLPAVKERYRKDPRVRFVANPERMGVARSRNRAVLEAQGRYVAYLDADDVWEKDKLRRQKALMDETGAVLCCTGRALMRADGTPTGRVIGVKERITVRDLLWHNCISCSSVLILTEVARKYQMLHEESHEDYITWVKVLREYGFAAGINEPLLRYRLSVGGKSAGKLRSAAMTYRAYRYMGYGPLRSMVFFVSYALHGVWKYRHV